MQYVAYIFKTKKQKKPIRFTAEDKWKIILVSSDLDILLVICYRVQSSRNLWGHSEK